MTIARATTPADLEACFAIRREVFVQEQQVPEAMEYDEFDATALHVLARQEGAPAGTARVVFKEGGRVAKIGRVAVRQALRGSGLGAAIMRAIEADPALDGAEELVLEAQSYAIPFYERLGYAAEGEEYLDVGIPHRLMRKRR
ncbi:GNAT family N-acetyltransferase [Pseudoroseomonas cervicalis]|uniref:Acetyltransferase, GNAT family n=1 Tax=Pseudoroseomonas cervicalis ATCC 49957 TaxID=525371 RepID=D5RKD3_9PROT|nr:GNAT family N-acetyltransferase [Pseudoroseomonas cervicalis]EFH12235.1 acetyltransferase, GNAT family [Pseudoroseomonas cervicalis ATCC 49957]